MPPLGYCTLEDVRRALRKSGLPGDVSQDQQIAVDAITAETDPLEKSLKRHWYEPGGIDEATEIEIPTEPKTRDDEHDISSHGGMVHGASERDRNRYRKNSDALLESSPRNDRRRRELRREPKREIRIAIGEYQDGYRNDRPAYTRIQLDRRDADAVNQLLVINSDGGYDDWAAADSGYEGGVGLENRGKDYWVRLNNGGVSELYIDAHALDDDIASLSNAVYIDWDYGHEGIPRAIRRAVALRAGAELTEEAALHVPDNARLYNVEAKADEMREKADDLLEEYR
ncbi:hypothetical protein [Natrialba aegyptia]|uniref:Uncharacterized protein n=1 Tax=Natrialba aegyptia DSM 13077 TaxID=1227491 RepID=M0B3L6_9EURY|nr:hypothetical protein [Natrialba aegyptia]ELZ05390.1 hypothetical protein C480_10425 [Natrialba aegyptia DSM 13077]